VRGPHLLFHYHSSGFAVTNSSWPCSGGAVYRFNMDGKDRKKFYEDEGSFAGIALCDA